MSFNWNPKHSMAYFHLPSQTHSLGAPACATAIVWPGSQESQAGRTVKLTQLSKTHRGHAPPPIESRKNYQSVNPYYVWTW